MVSSGKPERRVNPARCWSAMTMTIFGRPAVGAAAATCAAAAVCRNCRRFSMLSSFGPGASSLNFSRLILRRPHPWHDVGALRPLLPLPDHFFHASGLLRREVMHFGAVGLHVV